MPVLCEGSYCRLLFEHVFHNRYGINQTFYFEKITWHIEIIFMQKEDNFPSEFISLQNDKCVKESNMFPIGCFHGSENKKSFLQRK